MRNLSSAGLSESYPEPTANEPAGGIRLRGPSDRSLARRTLKPELLDILPADDPRALRSRADLRRLNAWMGHGRILARLLPKFLSRYLSVRLVELGGGDGHLLLKIARRLEGKWRRVDAVLVDRHDVVSGGTTARFAAVNWHVQPVTNDLFNWLRASERADGILANLVLHQFTDSQIAGLFRDAARKADLLVAIEPRRAFGPLICSRLLGLTGCGPVTRHDAPISVRAGFTRTELSALWPDPDNWSLTERPVGLFSHLFIAHRKQ